MSTPTYIAQILSPSKRTRFNISKTINPNNEVVIDRLRTHTAVKTIQAVLRNMPKGSTAQAHIMNVVTLW